MSAYPAATGTVPTDDSTPSPLEDAVPQFFISLVNQSDSSLTLTACRTSFGCGWVQEPVLGEQIAALGERIWCAMPWDLDCGIDVDLTLENALGIRVRIHFSRHYPARAEGQLDIQPAVALTGTAELQRADSSSPFLMITLQTAD
ncbi:hypothetical protein [Chitinimonas naiadis]